MANASSVRLNKFLAHAVGLSRRSADEAIAAGRVTVNGQTSILGARINPIHDTVLLDSKPIQPKAYTYLALHKPRGYVSSRRKQGESETIYALLPPEFQALKPVGRLDRDSSGLLLLTDDGDFAYEMTHPKFHKTKTYEVMLDHALEPLHRQMISDYGVTLDDGVSKLQLERLSDADETRWRIIMHEGRNRQIRRTFASLGYTVTSLHRTTFGVYSLIDGKGQQLKNGEYKLVDFS